MKQRLLIGLNSVFVSLLCILFLFIAILATTGLIGVVTNILEPSVGYLTTNIYYSYFYSLFILLLAFYCITYITNISDDIFELCAACCIDHLETGNT